MPAATMANSSLGGIRFIITRAKSSPLIGAYVIVGRSLKVPPTPTLTSSDRSKVSLKKSEARLTRPSSV